MSSALEFLRFPPLGLVSKARLAATILYASRVKDWRRLENIPVADWLRTLVRRPRPSRRSGCRCCAPSSARATRRPPPPSSGRPSPACTPPAEPASRRRCSATCPGATPGCSRSSTSASSRMECSVELGTEVSQVIGASHRTRSRWRSQSGDQNPFDQVVVTLARADRREALSRPRSRRADRGSTASSTRASSARRSCSKNRSRATTSPTSPTHGLPFTAVIEMTALVDPDRARRPHPRLPAQVPGERRPGVRRARRRRGSDRFMDALLRMYPHLEPDDLLAFQVSRERFVYPAADPRLLGARAADSRPRSRVSTSSTRRRSSTAPSTSTKPSSSRRQPCRGLLEGHAP